MIHFNLTSLLLRLLPIILFLLIVGLLAWIELAFGAMITHSHCPNHSRNNSENMHTHDTTDADHNEKHKAGHPHTWEFDEFCPPGTERDVKKKSRGYVPPSPCVGCDSPVDTPDDPDDKRRSVRMYSHEGREFPKPLRITEVRKIDGVLTIVFDAIHENGGHNYLYIVIDGFEFPTPAQFFGFVRFSLGERREVVFTPKVFNGINYVLLERLPYPHVVSGHLYPKRSHPNPNVDGYDTIVDFDVLDFSIQLRNYSTGGAIRDSVTQDDFDSKGNRLESVPSAPSLVRRKLATTWASLKVSK